MYVVYKISSGVRNSPLDDNTARSITRFVPSLLLNETKCLWHWNLIKAQCVTGAHVGLQSPGYLEGRQKKRFQERSGSDWEGLMGIAWDFKFCPESLEGLMKNFKQENHMIKSVFHKGNHLAIWKTELSWPVGRNFLGKVVSGLTCEIQTKYPVWIMIMIGITLYV